MLVVGYVLIQLVSNLTVLKTVSLVGAYAIPVGSLLFAISYTWIDLVNEYLGKSRARWLVLIAIAANVLMILWFEFYIHVPGTSQWETDPTNQAAISLVLGSVPRIYAASLFTNFVVENVDITIYHWVRTRTPWFPRWLRGAASNTVSAPLDGLLFATLAFAGRVDGDFLVRLILTSALYKLAVAYASLPLLYIMRARGIGSRAQTSPA